MKNAAPSPIPALRTLLGSKFAACNKTYGKDENLPAVSFEERRLVDCYHESRALKEFVEAIEAGQGKE